MNEQDLKKIINNFNESEWRYDVKNNIATYECDFDLQMKLVNKRSREEDEFLNDDTWNDLFQKYKNAELIDISITYRGAEVGGSTNLLNNNIFIPLPIAANIIDEFYENELNIARVFSHDKNKFVKMFKGAKTRKKNY